MDLIKICTATAIAGVFTFSSCNDDDETNNTTNNQQVTDTEIIVSGTWRTGETITLDKHLVIPEGESLTIEPGVSIIVSENGVGANHTPIEISVKGNLYAIGSAAKPITFSVDPSLRTQENTFKGLWGGIVAYATCQEMALDNVVIEYTGAQVIEGSPAATEGVYTAGDDMYPQVTTNNIYGKYVISNSIIRNGASDGIYMMGGNAIIANNTFAANGSTGADAVNMKAGVKADIAANIMFSPNTNGMKLSSSGQNETRGQLLVNAYNNTIINAGWRRDGEKGGSIYVEKNALVNIVNNLIVNCKFRTMTPKYKDPNKADGGYDDKSIIDYNFYASGSQTTPIVGDATVGSPAEGYAQNNKNYNPAVDMNSFISAPSQLLDPGFVSFDINAVSLTDYTYNTSWDLHLLPNSPATVGADGNVNPYFAEGLTIGSKTYTSPYVQHYFGALGTK
ncbi:MAG: right-handed parallel beta-helix repeat-containing protein [Bacteroidia bacterium]|nr:right-handed parallel beta-helix repeat-containing protein [Bacteroidia bacterium]